MNTNDVVDAREWIYGIAVLVGMFFLAPTIRTLLKKFAEKKHLSYLRQLAPAVAALVYIFGFKVFGQVAPISPKLALWLEDGVYVLAVLIILRIIRGSLLISADWMMNRAGQSATVGTGFAPVLRNVITLFVFFMGTIMILKHFNYDVFSLLTALGVGSLAVGLAAKDTLSNMISGFILLMDRNLRPGDRLNLGTYSGDVDEIGLRSTRIKTGEGNMLIVPNSDLVNSKLINASMPSREGICSVSFRVPYAAAFSKVREICVSAHAEVARAHAGKKPWINISNVLDGGQQIEVGFWIPDMDDAGEAKTDFILRLQDRLLKENIPLVGPGQPS
jgi:small-conductance mechanosensitive channel